MRGRVGVWNKQTNNQKMVHSVYVCTIHTGECMYIQYIHTHGRAFSASAPHSSLWINQSRRPVFEKPNRARHNTQLNLQVASISAWLCPCFRQYRQTRLLNPCYLPSCSFSHVCGLPPYVTCTWQYLPVFTFLRHGCLARVNLWQNSEKKKTR